MNRLTEKFSRLLCRKPQLKKLVPTNRPGVHVVAGDISSIRSDPSSTSFSPTFVPYSLNSWLSLFRAIIFQHSSEAPSHNLEFPSSTSIMSDPEKNSVLLPPECVRGMKKLDRSAFARTVTIPVLRVPVKSLAAIRKVFKPLTLTVPGVKPIAELEEADEQRNSHRLLLLHPDKVGSVADLGDKELAAMTEAGLPTSSLETYALELGYSNWSVSEVTAAILPDPSLRVSSFSLIGHIAHLNLKEEVLDFKHVIGQVILDKTPTVKTVVNKVNSIDNTFRNFQMELLAGEENYDAQVRENGCTFQFDFSKVYWNPRLGTEHSYIVSLLKAGDVLYDVFAGVGPFAIPAARKGVVVLANDLNPNSHAGLLASLKLNKVRIEPRTFCMDGRAFVTSAVKEDLINRLSAMLDSGVTSSCHVVMNLPALALEFLDAFRGLLHGSDISHTLQGDSSDSKAVESIRQALPLVHVYGFSKEENPEQEIKARAEESLGVKLPQDSAVRFVRNVAPNKDMHCLTFRLPLDVTLLDPASADSKSGSDDQVVCSHAGGDCVDGDGSGPLEESSCSDSQDDRPSMKKPRIE